MTMTGTDGAAMKARLRADLSAAMKARRSDETGLLRALVAALDNAEAPALPAAAVASEQRRFDRGEAETRRLDLGPAEVRAILRREIEERERAAEALDRHGMAERAAALRAEAALVRRYAG